MPTETPSPFRSKILPGLALAAILALGAFLRFYNLGAASIGNGYYAAAVKSMLTSWHNFFFVAFEPGGSISVDKPPLGFWLETLSAYLLGLNGFALAFPNALSGTLSIALLYSLVKKQFGRLAGLFAALALAVMPVTIAAERNNTIDGMLVFVLLLAAWAVWKSVESGRFGYLLLGALFVGLGFNIKMLQAFMILPGLYALYFFGAKHAWGRRIVQLGLATALLAVVSLSWALVVDAVPADSRPFIGSSTDNTVTELIVGHNGIRRILGGGGQMAGSLQPDGGGKGPGSASLTGHQPPTPPGGFTQSTRSGGPNEVGEAGIFRLFNEPLATQASWLLPLALMGLALALFVCGFSWPLTEKHLALILWAGWLLPMLLYFTFTGGLWHTYYLIMLGPALAALVGAAVWAFERLGQRWGGLRWGLLLALMSGITLGFELFVLSGYRTYFPAASALMLLLWLAGMALLAVRPRAWALGLTILSLLVAPLLWSGLTTFNPQPEVNLPKAGPLTAAGPGGDPSGMTLSVVQQKVLAYLEANTAPESYLAATLDTHGASPFILATGRPFFTFGGYVGNDNVVDVAGLQKLVNNGTLRFILDNGNLSKKAEIFAWVQANCPAAQIPGLAQSARKVSSDGGPNDQQFSALYDCGG